MKSMPWWVSLGVHSLVGAACLSFALVTSIDFEQPVGDAVAFDVHPPEPPAEKPPEPISREISVDPPHLDALVPDDRIFRIPEIHLPGLPEAVKDRPPHEPLEMKRFTSELKTASDSEPKISRNPKPHYPILARRKGWEGQVIVRVQVDIKGKPLQAHVVVSSGRDVLDQAALEAVQQWTFEPAQRSGRATEGSIDITFEFRLSR